MSHASEKDWTQMFAYAPATIMIHRTPKCTCGNGNCKRAKKIRCTCRCHSEYHGAANRRGMEPLDQTLGLDELTVTALHDQLGSKGEVVALTRSESIDIERGDVLRDKKIPSYVHPAVRRLIIQP